MKRCRALLLCAALAATPAAAGAQMTMPMTMPMATAPPSQAPITPAEGGGQKFYLKADLPQIAHQADHAAH